MNQNNGSARRRMLKAVGNILCGAGLLAGALSLIGPAAFAQAYPDKPVRLVVPFGAGGAVDIVARILAADLTKRLGQNFVVENRTGAGGNIAASFVAKSDPDGYTLLMGSTGNSVNGSLYSNLNYDPDRDLAPVALVGTVPTLLLANPSVQANNVKELIALARSNPNSLNFASGGSGTTEHLAAEMFNAQAKVDIKHIPYRGGNAALTDVIGGHVQLMFTNQLNAIPYLKAGTLKALGIASEKRSPVLPDISTFIEQGMKDFTVSVWWGVFAPAHIPDAVEKTLNQAINAAISSPQIVAQLAKLGATPRSGTPQEFTAFFRQESAKWKNVVETAHIKVD